MDKIKIVDCWKTSLTNWANYLLPFLSINWIYFSGLRNISATCAVYKLSQNLHSFNFLPSLSIHLWMVWRLIHSVIL